MVGPLQLQVWGKFAAFKTPMKSTDQSSPTLIASTRQRILVSSCLLGEQVRYDGGALTVTEKFLHQWLRDGWVIPCCPEVEAGMSIPRPPCEIHAGDGKDVLAGGSRVLQENGTDTTDLFLRGAHKALDLCREHHVQIAVLTESSPSCGSHTIHDGCFSGTKITGTGVTTALLLQNGIQVFSQFQIPEAALALRRLPQ